MSRNADITLSAREVLRSPSVATSAPSRSNASGLGIEKVATFCQPTSVTKRKQWTRPASALAPAFASGAEAKMRDPLPSDAGPSATDVPNMSPPTAMGVGLSRATPVPVVPAAPAVRQARSRQAR